MNQNAGKSGKGPEPDILADTRPFTLAAAFLANKGWAEPVVTVSKKTVEEIAGITVTRLRHWREEFYEFRQCVYRRLLAEDLVSNLTKYLNSKRYYGGKEMEPTPLRVNGTMVNDAVRQLRAICQVRAEAMPAWLDPEGGRPDPDRVISFTNGLLDLKEWMGDRSAPLEPSTPAWFSNTVIPRPFEPRAECPAFLRFLRQGLVDDDQIARAQEFAGYCLTRDTSLQKFLAILGPGGGGKSTFARILTEMIGGENVVNFSLWDLAERFTLSSFLGKTLAISRDARLGNGGEAYKVLEQLLAIVGEDDRSVDRKNRDLLEGVRLSTRIILIANSIPHLPDGGIAMKRRALFLSFDQSFADRPDLDLVDTLRRELPGVTAWAMEGLRRLHRNGRVFTATDREKELLDRLVRQASAVQSFVQDWCEVPAIPEGRPPREMKFHVWRAWVAWAEQHGEKPTPFTPFCEKVYEAAAGKVRNCRIRIGDWRPQVFEGIRILPEAFEAAVAKSGEKGDAMRFERQCLIEGRDPQGSGCPV